MFKLQWKKPIGLSFELLVEGILKGLFPTTDFVRTKYVHDGGKDFYAVLNDEDDIWVEAKNYNNHLELSKFANTFIMADINKINRIIIFSVSPL
ncbi:MAG: hypothetical protein J1F61_03695, partial [Clostridiales bacterium]|nr:hypothetical protein [Clostridiales bacterium]